MSFLQTGSILRNLTLVVLNHYYWRSRLYTWLHADIFSPIAHSATQESMDFLWINILFEVEHMTRWQVCVEDGRCSTNWSKNEALSRTTGWTVSHLIVITGKTTAPECTVFKQKITSVKLFGFCCIFRSQYYVQIALAQNFCKGWGSYVYCVNMVRINEFTQRVWALPLTEILC